MSWNDWCRAWAAALGIAFAAICAWPAAAAAQTVTGQARAVQANALVTTVLADTGTLDGTSDARDATLDVGIVPAVLSGEVLRAVTIGWPDHVVSEASLANLNMSVGGIAISADFVMAKASAVLGASGAGSSIVANLSVNGVPIVVTGNPNQRVSIPGGQVVINEQATSVNGTTVNAIHATVLGVADVVSGYAAAGIRSF